MIKMKTISRKYERGCGQNNSSYQLILELSGE